MSIKVSIIKRFKSVDVCEFTLPNFSVLTGKNGSGKSHLLEAMTVPWGDTYFMGAKTDSPAPTIAAVAVDENKKCRNIRLVPFGQLNPNINEKCDPSEIGKFFKRCFGLYPQAWNYWGRERT